MDYRSRWQEKRRERAVRQRVILIAVAVVLVIGAVIFFRGLVRPASAGYRLPAPGVSWLSTMPDGVLVSTRAGELIRLTPQLQPATHLWPSRFTHPAGFWGRPAVADGYVLVGCEDVRVRGIDRTTGVQSWELEVGGAVRGVAAEGQYAYFASAEPALYAVNADGTQIWRTALAGKVPAAPLVTEETVIVGSLAGSVSAFDRASGEPLWSVQAEDASAIYPTPVMGPSSILVGDDAGRLHSIARSGELLASMEFDGLVREPVAVSEAVVVAGDSSGLVRRINPADMTEIWSCRLPEALAAPPMIVGNAVWCAVGRRLVALDTEDGTTLKQRVARALISDAVAAYDRIYWSTIDGHIGTVALED